MDNKGNSSYSAGGVEAGPLAATRMCRKWQYKENKEESERNLGQILFDTLRMTHGAEGEM